jgi:hypothetical protein
MVGKVSPKFWQSLPLMARKLHHPQGWASEARCEMVHLGSVWGFCVFPHTLPLPSH